MLRDTEAPLRPSWLLLGPAFVAAIAYVDPGNVAVLSQVMRDGDDNGVIVCSIENVDPMGVHTGDSITVAPVQTLTDVEYQRMRDAALRCIRAIGVETGGSNVQFAVHPRDGRMVLIEMNPRVSRSSALASKATGLPDREDRRAARRRLPAGRDHERHHGGDARRRSSRRSTTWS